jgi:predicted NBD/HSP70 family sugar kinase
MSVDSTFGAFLDDETHRGGNQVGVKYYNERLILSLIREAGSLPKADIARITRLSAQTVTTIVNRLLKVGLLRKKEVIRGRIGQPSTPIEIAPDGAISIGVKIGRRSLDLLALSFDRRVVVKKSFGYDALSGDLVSDLMGTAFDSLKGALSNVQRSRLIGVGIAAPTAIEAGQAVIGDPGGTSPRWREADLVARAEETSGLKAVVLNDATAACLAEIDARRDSRNRSMVYFYVSTLIGGGIVLQGNIIAGRTGNAGAVGAIPLALAAKSRKSKPAQLIEATSLNRLEDLAVGRKLTVSMFREDGGSVAELDARVLDCFDEWCDLAADALAFAAISGTSFIEADSVVIDGVLLRPLLDRLIVRVQEQVASYNLEGIIIPEFRIGSIGFDARAIGAALIPLNEQFAPDNKVVLKS